jgi:hypothetical protein
MICQRRGSDSTASSSDLDLNMTNCGNIGGCTGGLPSGVPDVPSPAGVRPRQGNLHRFAPDAFVSSPQLHPLWSQRPHRMLSGKDCAATEEAPHLCGSAACFQFSQCRRSSPVRTLASRGTSYRPKSPAPSQPGISTRARGCPSMRSRRGR